MEAEISSRSMCWLQDVGIHSIKAGLGVIYHFWYLLGVLGHIPLGLGAD